MDRLDHGVRLSRQEPIDVMRPSDRLGLGATAAVERGPDAGEGEQRPILIERELNNIFLFSLGVGLRRVFGEAVGRHQAAVLWLQPAAPMRRRRVADLENGAPPMRDGGGMPQRMVTSSMPAAVFRITGAG